MFKLKILHRGWGCRIFSVFEDSKLVKYCKICITYIVVLEIIRKREKAYPNGFIALEGINYLYKMQKQSIKTVHSCSKLQK